MSNRHVQRLNLVFASALLLSMSVVRLSAQAPNPAATLFEKSCYSCHSIGGGDKQGPDLKGVGTRRTRDWIKKFVPAPAAMKASGDAIAADLFKRFSPQVMPDQTLAPDQIEQLIAFIDEVSASGRQFIPAGAKLARAVTPRDAALGMRLFNGADKLTNGGPACITCHSVARVGTLGGGTLGPDLTLLNVRFPDPAVISLLQNPNLPTMISVFGTQALTPEEIVRLFALFQSEAAVASHSQILPTGGWIAPGSLFIIYGAVGMLIGLGTIQLLWRRRLSGVREHLIRRTKL